MRLAYRYSKDLCSTKEKEVFEHFLTALQERKLNWELTDEDASRMRMLLHIKQRIDEQSNLRYTIVRIAAAIAFLVTMISMGYYFVTSPSMMEEVTYDGQKREVILPDGSLVVLNSGSIVRYPSRFTDSRTVTLEGEAFFQVVKDSSKPFVVVTKLMHTKVLGTSFNVSAYKDRDSRVNVMSGKVAVQAENSPNEQVILKANEQVLVSQRTKHLFVTEEPAGRYSSCRLQTLEFDNATLKEVAFILEQKYGVTILFDTNHISDLKLTGVYKSPKIENVLESISFLKGVKYRYTDPYTIIWYYPSTQNLQKKKPM